MATQCQSSPDPCSKGLHLVPLQSHSTRLKEKFSCILEIILAVFCMLQLPFFSKLSRKTLILWMGWRLNRISSGRRYLQHSQQLCTILLVQGMRTAYLQPLQGAQGSTLPLPSHTDAQAHTLQQHQRPYFLAAPMVYTLQSYQELRQRHGCRKNCQLQCQQELCMTKIAV